MRVNSKFKLEDVSMGMWMTYMGGEINFDHDARIREEGCGDGDISSHYQTPEDMLCIHKISQRMRNETGQRYSGCCDASRLNVYQ